MPRSVSSSSDAALGGPETGQCADTGTRGRRHSGPSPGVSVDSDALPAAAAGAGAGPGRAQGRGGRAPVRGRTHRAQTFLLPRGL